MKTCDMTETGVPYTAIREMSILKTLQGHENIVTVHDLVLDPTADVFHIVFDCYPMTLSSYIQGYQRNGIAMSTQTIQAIASQLCSAIAHCHGKFIMHRDLKPCNVMMTNDLTIKVGDFGISRYMAYPIGPSTREVVTLYYRSPEILLGEAKYGFGVDSWSVGCILAELLNLQVLFKGNDQIDQLVSICTLLGVPESEYYARLPNYKVLRPELFDHDSRLATVVPPDHFLYPIVEGLLDYSLADRWDMVRAMEYLGQVVVHS
ncbi:Cyclin-dependent kinase catalytic subunit [Allomyces javanicus]|nr:Cyclin-dependent kinase catalytic subunit [Allomyces javanicus]